MPMSLGFHPKSPHGPTGHIALRTVTSTARHRSRSPFLLLTPATIANAAHHFSHLGPRISKLPYLPKFRFMLSAAMRYTSAVQILSFILVAPPILGDRARAFRRN